MKIWPLIASALVLFFTLIGCGGGHALIVGDIQGPDALDENASAEYSVTATGKGAVTYLWAVTPPGVAALSDDDKATVSLSASAVTSDTQVILRVIVVLGDNNPEVRMKTVLVNDIGQGGEKLEVDEIEGPSLLKEGEAGSYGVQARGDTGIKIEWRCDPEYSGFFSKPDSEATAFTPREVSEDTDITISVVVNSDRFGPVSRTKKVDVQDVVADEWVRTWGSHYADESDVAYGVCVNDYGDVFVTGCFSGPVDFDPGPGVDMHSALVYWDPFVSKFDAQGDFEWSRTWTGSSVQYYDAAHDVAVDGSGNVYVTGQFAEDMDFDPGPLPDYRSSSGYYDVFVTKFDSLGNYLWARAWGGSGDDEAYGIATDESGNVYVAGSFEDMVDFDPGSGSHVITAEGSSDAFLSKLTPEGEFVWVRTMGGAGSMAYALDASTDGAGNVTICGYFFGLVDFGSGVTFNWIMCAGGADTFAASFTPSGEPRWANAWGGEGEDYGMGVAAADNGDTFVAGHYDRTCDFDPGPIVDYRPCMGYTDSYLSMFDASGQYLWTRTWGGAENDQAYGVAIGDMENVYVVGFFSDVVDFDPGPGSVVLTAQEGASFLSKFDSMGNFLSVRACAAYAGAVAAGRDGFSYTAGYFLGEVNFLPGIDSGERTSIGGGDAFVLKLPPEGW